MTRSNFLTSVFSVACLITVISAAVAGHDGRQGLRIDRESELACHRAVKERTPHGQRDLRTLSYEEVGTTVGQAFGALKSEFEPGRWSVINWTCRLNADTGRVVNIEFSWPHGGSRLSRIAASL